MAVKRMAAQINFRIGDKPSGILVIIPTRAFIRTKQVNPSYTFHNSRSTIRLSTLEGRVMKAIVRTKYGPSDALQFREVEKPTPKDNEVLIKLHAASVKSTGLVHHKRCAVDTPAPGAAHTKG